VPVLQSFSSRMDTNDRPSRCGVPDWTAAREPCISRASQTCCHETFYAFDLACKRRRRRVNTWETRRIAIMDLWQPRASSPMSRARRRDRSAACALEIGTVAMNRPRWVWLLLFVLPAFALLLSFAFRPILRVLY
jgi:hypothetical protein